MSGLPDIDVDDWERNTEYSGAYDATTPVIRVSALIPILCQTIH